MMRESGFTLIEILVVLVLLALIATMLPAGLNKLYARSSSEALAQSLLSQLRDCASLSQAQQRMVRVGAQDCELPKRTGFEIAYSNGIAPVFFVDGTSNGAGLELQEKSQGSKTSYQIAVNRFSSEVSLQRHVGKP